MDDQVIFYDDRTVNYLLLVKNNYERLLNKNKEFIDQLCYVNKNNPYNSEIPLDVRLLVNSDKITDVHLKIQEINMLLNNQIEKTDELLNKYCDHSYVEDTVETKNEVLVDVEYCAHCYLNKE